jgi:hypothetical protein
MFGALSSPGQVNRLWGIRADTLFAVVHRAEFVQIQKLGQLAGIHAIVMVSDFQQAFLRGSQATTRVT